MKTKLIGMRSLKTGLAVIIGLLAAYLLNIESATILAGSIIISMQTSLHDSFETAFFRVFSTIVGALLGLFFQLMHFANAFTAGIGVIIIIYLCNVFNVKKALVLATMVLVSIIVYDYDSRIELVYYSLDRLFATFLGALIAFLINFTFFKPKQEKFLVESYHAIIPQIDDYLKEVLAGKDINEPNLISKVNDINDKYSSLRNDTKFKLRNKLSEESLQTLNNKFRLVISLLIDLENMGRTSKLTKNTVNMVNGYYKEQILEASSLLENDLVTQASVVYNYDLRRIITNMKQLKAEVHLLEEDI